MSHGPDSMAMILDRLERRLPDTRVRVRLAPVIEVAPTHPPTTYEVTHVERPHVLHDGHWVALHDVTDADWYAREMAA